MEGKKISSPPAMSVLKSLSIFDPKIIPAEKNTFALARGVTLAFH
jgi:hypothetical protein